MLKAIDIFGEWAKEGRDVGMEKAHEISVNEMIDFALEERSNIGERFSFFDLGCGNGWVVRKVARSKLCDKAVGIDGAKQMIVNAESKGGGAKYIFADINSFHPTEKYDVVHSMEVLYYLDDPSELLKRISDSWLNDGGRLIIGIDHYYENIDSHSWQEKLGTKMLMLKEVEWIQIFKIAGLNEVESWRSNKDENWAGTLVITGKK